MKKYNEVVETKNIRGYEISKYNSYCEVKRNEEVIYEGVIDENLSHEDIYQIVTAKLVFKFKEKTLLKYSIIGSFESELDSTLELLAYENNCNKEDIKVSIENQVL